MSGEEINFFCFTEETIMVNAFDKLKSLGYIGSTIKAPMVEQPIVRVKMYRVVHPGYGEKQ